MSNLVDEARKHYQESAPHIKGRYTSQLINKMADEIKQLQQRVSELEAAILTHVEELGMIPDAETVQWWVENNQPVDIQTVKKPPEGGE